MRTTVEAWETKRYKNRIEYGYCVDGSGHAISETRGGSGSVRISVLDMIKTSVYSHVHPRTGTEDGTIGGTFSIDDLKVFTKYATRSSLSAGRMTTFRATALEGTYSISKTSHLDVKGLLRYYDTEDRKLVKVRDDAVSDAVSRYAKKEISWAEVEKIETREMNRYLVGMHNALLAGQKQYGYIYTLERR